MTQRTPSLKTRARSLRGFCLRLLLSLRYRLEVCGMDDIAADRPMLFLANHPSLLDPLLVYACLDGLRPRPLADENQFNSPLLRWVKNLIGVITIPDYNRSGPAARAGTLKGLADAAEVLRAGGSVLLYPGGALQREAHESIRNTSSVSRILRDAPQTVVIGVRIEGMWGSSFSRASRHGQRPDLMRDLWRGLGVLVANLIFFTPRRRLCITFAEAREMPRPGAEDATNASARRAITSWINDFFSPDLHEQLVVTYYFWQRRS